MPSFLRNDNDDVQTARAELGWFICGIWLTCAWTCPIILARHAYFAMRIAWFTSIGTWGFIGTMGMALVFLVKGSQPSGSVY